MSSGSIFFAILIQACFWLISYGVSRRLSADLLERLLNATTIYFVVIIFSSVILSLFTAFHTVGIVIALLIYGVGAGIYLTRYGKSSIELKKINMVELMVLLMATFFTTIILIRSWGIIDITHDSIVFVMPRIHLFQQLNGFLFDSYSNIVNIWYNQMNFEILAAHWNILTQSVFLAKIPNQIFYFWGVLASFLLLQRLFIGRWLAFFGAATVALLPVNFLIAHTIKSDGALFASMVASVYYFCIFWQSGSKKYLLLFALASCLTIGIKVTALPFICLLFLVLIIFKGKAISELCTHDKTITFLVLIVAFVIGLHRYCANWIHYGDPLIRSTGEEIFLSFQTAFSSIMESIKAQFTNIATAQKFDLSATTMEDVLGANGGYAFLPFLMLGPVGMLYAFRKNTLMCSVIIVTLFYSILIIATRPWFPWSTRYFMILFFIIVLGSVYAIQELHTKNKKISSIIVGTCSLLMGIQTFQIIAYDRSLWLENRFSNISVITRYDTIETFPEIEKESAILFIAHPNAPIYQYIKPENEILFQKPVPIDELIGIMKKKQISYLVITNLHRELLQDIASSKSFDAIRLRNENPDQNSTNLFKLNRRK